MKRRGQSFSPNNSERRPGITEISDEFRWNALVRNGLYPNITSMEIYDEKVTERLKQLRQEFIETTSQPVVDPGMSKMIHYYLFQDVHPWAGQFRKGVETVMIGIFPGADPGRVAREMDIWALQTRALLEDAKTNTDVLAAIAFSHVKFERVHPFKDGNGRTGRCLLNSQCHAIYGPKNERLFDRNSYLEAMRIGSTDLYPLMVLVAIREGMEPPEPAQFTPKMRIAPFFHPVEEFTLQEDFTKSTLPKPSR